MLGGVLGLLVGRRLDLDGSFEAVRGAAARVEGDEAREDESRHGADGRRDDQAGVVAAAGRLLLGAVCPNARKAARMSSCFCPLFQLTEL